MSPGRDKRPRPGAFLPDPQKRPRIESDPGNTARETPVWQFHRLDRVGHDDCRPWHEMSGSQLWEIHQKLCSIESMTWQQIDSAGSHYIEPTRVEAAARRRLERLGLLEDDTLYSLRLDGKHRIWGLRVGRVLKVLWWDPDHTVYPAPKKHT